VNIQHLRHSLKVKWLLYYRQNRQWLVKLQIWGTYDGQRRPSSSFILATLSNLEPQLKCCLLSLISAIIPTKLWQPWSQFPMELKSMTETNGVAQTNARQWVEQRLMAWLRQTLMAMG